MTEVIGNSIADPTTVLAAPLGSADTSLTVASAAELPASGTFRLRVDDELIAVGARSGTTCSSLTRGVEGTTAATHASGASVNLVLTAAGLTAFVSETRGSAFDYVQNGDPGAVGAGKSWLQTFTVTFVDNSTADYAQFWIRNTGDTAWTQIGAGTIVAPNAPIDGSGDPVGVSNAPTGWYWWDTDQGSGFYRNEGDYDTPSWQSGLVADNGIFQVISDANDSRVGWAGGEMLAQYEAFPSSQVRLNPSGLDLGGLPVLNLPTSDPGVAGALWNNSGTPAISSGP